MRKNLVKILVALLKVGAAGLMAIAILSLIFVPYSTSPVHIANEKGNTDYVWPAGSRWLNMTEGISHGTFDSNGYNNVSEVENPDIVILGSSHMEAVCLNQNENVAYLLGEKFKGMLTVYNRGISGHDFVKTCRYLEENLLLDERAPKYAVIETSSIELIKSEVDRILSKTTDYTPSYDHGIIAFLQKSPFLRQVYRQLEKGIVDVFVSDRDKEILNVFAADNETEEPKENYSRLFKYLSDIAGRYNTKLIIFYHPQETIVKDGTINFFRSENEMIFSDMAEEYGIEYINMSDDFTISYLNNHTLPHGFSNGLIGSGHLNKHGSRDIANRLYQVIVDSERGN